MIRKTFAAVALCVALSGCATQPDQFRQGVANAVENTQTAAVATVSIGTELVKAIIALYQPVTDVLHIFGV